MPCLLLVSKCGAVQNRWQRQIEGGLFVGFFYTFNGLILLLFGWIKLNLAYVVDI
jgi:hypothetical protein